mgnify:CR=1 FL=1
MKISGTTCYSHLLWVMCGGEKTFGNAIRSITFDTPDFVHEGLAGYIETKYTIEVHDLVAFARLWESWYALSDKKRLDLYGLAKGLGDCK